MKKYSFFSKEYSIIKCLFIALYAVILLIGIYLPIQTDEITWGIINHRAIADDFNLISLMPQCLDFQSFSKPAPYLLYPYYFVNHYLFFQFENPIWIRIIGVLRAVIFITLLWIILKSLSKSFNLEKIKLFLLALALLSLEEIPLILTVYRPEQSLLLACSLMIFLALNHDLKLKKHFDWLLYILPALTTLLAFPSHPKAIAILPIILACSAIFYYKKTNSKTITFITSIGIIGFALFCTRFWLYRMDCPNSPEILEVILRHSLPLNLIASDPIQFAKQTIGVFFNALYQDFSISIFLINRNDWIPISLFDLNSILSVLYYILFAFSYITKIIIFFIALYLCTKIFWSLVCYKKISKKQIISISIFTSILALMLISGNNRMFYLVSLQVPLLIILFLLCSDSEKILKFKKIINILIIIALINLSFLIFRYFAYVGNTANQIGMITKYRQILFSPWEFNKEKTKVNKALEICRFDNAHKVNRIVTDDFTYPYLKNSYMPFSFMYVTNMFAFGDNAYNHEKFFKFLNDFKSEGVFIDCRTAPDKLKNNMQQLNGYCCLKLKNKEK